MGGLLGAHYFLGNRLLATTSRLPMWADAVVQVTSVGMMCPACGEAWGRVVNTTANSWTFMMRECQRHGSGSFIAPWANQFEELPPEVLHYELQLRLNQFEETLPCSPTSSSPSL